MKLLVAGGDRVDAGKTTFAVGLLRWLSLPTRAYKPRAGNDFWFDHDDALTALDGGRLYGKDAARLVEAEGTGDRPEARNPIHRLWRPTPDHTGMLGQEGRTFLVDRVSTADGPRFVVNGSIQLPPAVRRALPLEGARRVGSVGEFNEVMAEVHLPALERTAEAVRATRHVVVESYADVADPLRGVDYDAVAIVDPGRHRVFDGRRWAIACDAAGGSADGQLEERVGRVTDMLDPVATAPLPPLTSDARSDPDAVAEAYADAYETLADAADTVAGAVESGE